MHNFYILVDYRSKRKRYVLLSPLRRQMGLALARRSYKGLINKCYDDAGIRSIILNKIGRQLEKEMKKMCFIKRFPQYCVPILQN